MDVRLILIFFKFFLILKLIFEPQVLFPRSASKIYFDEQPLARDKSKEQL